MKKMRAMKKEEEKEMSVEKRAKNLNSTEEEETTRIQTEKNVFQKNKGSLFFGVLIFSLNDRSLAAGVKFIFGLS